ncbi:hypothetical protein TPHA_0B01340 [Tetrapisispora phaffii CBS 4417]|uniref:PX domain-containing protein n=1 Tax=Tetrapisispora phaffii (strain ATCC 24235 / CBS 4417 / NBRC 1672 / NRRL Y-8282 / UCD 70-5) TaxID=1071381 RepID=G8BP76_TETPH|nr:hypothetical protein TPHA_0B01340 [Tetrapisispora phaffii CBS 4417]CCE61807.1 hypothetical protein TPHA_0B01340 [Tetrapisispora phaffii CBS 4417]
MISIEENGFCLVRSISSIGTGLVPMDYLDENVELSKSLGLPPIFTKNKPLVSITPPTSPMTIISKNFSIASISRSKTISQSNLKGGSTVDKIDEDNRDHVNTFLSAIEYCKLTHIESKENRLLYHLAVRSSSTHKEYTSERYYESFYRLHSMIAELAPPSLKIPRLPIPHCCTNNMKPDSYLDSNRMTTLNNYLTELVNVIVNCTSPILRQLLFVWLTKDTVELLDYRLMMIKVRYNNQYFAINCKDNEIAVLKELKEVIKKRIPGIPEEETYKIKANLDGWYIVELSNDDIYQQAFIKGWQVKFLDLEIE